ncbi:MAG: serine/threonine protein kinase, partial [Planctomycetota bacterium]
MPTSEDIQFGQVALANGMITQEQLTECLDSQELLEQMNMQESLSNILLKKGYMSKDQVEIILQMMGKKTEATKIGGYEILEKLGEGGMGMVYKAKQINMDRIVALKILSPSFAKDPSYIERFFREARSAGKLDHPNIVRGIDVGEAEGYYYFSMEYVEGETLSQYLERVGKLNERAAAMVVIQVAKALDHAHQNGIIHRDIKPDNIFLSKSNVVKLGDLGLAKPEGDVSLTAIGIPVGTPCYISPEQATNAGDVDIRSDIYSLGITLYQMLTGSVPHQETGYLDAMQKRVQEELPPVTTLNPNLSKEIVFILEKMTRLNREERFQTPKALITTIQNYLRGGKLSPDGSHILPPQAKPKSMFRVHDHPSLEATRPLETQPPHRLTPVSNEAPPSNPLENQPPEYSPITSSLKPPKDIPLEFSEDTKEEFHLPSQIPPLEIEPPTEMEELASPSSAGTEIDFEETRATMAAAPTVDEAPLHIAPKLQPAKEKESPKSSPKTKIQ